MGIFLTPDAQIFNGLSSRFNGRFSKTFKHLTNRTDKRFKIQTPYSLLIPFAFFKTKQFSFTEF